MIRRRDARAWILRPTPWRGWSTAKPLTTAFRTLDDASNLPENYLNPYYLEDHKHRIAVARVNGTLYAFDEICAHEACPSPQGCSPA